MTKMILILLIGLTCESTGIVLLKKGMDQIGEINPRRLDELVRAVKLGVTNPQILSGVFFQALFFGCLLILMSKSDISFLWPLTSLSFVFATFAAMIFLHEHVSGVRWIGVALIMCGAAFISYSQKLEENKKMVPPVSVSARPD